MEMSINTMVTRDSGKTATNPGVDVDVQAGLFENSPIASLMKWIVEKITMLKLLCVVTSSCSYITPFQPFLSIVSTLFICTFCI